MVPGSWRVRALTGWEDGEQLRVGVMMSLKTDSAGVRGQSRLCLEGGGAGGS